MYFRITSEVIFITQDEFDDVVYSEFDNFISKLEEWLKVKNQSLLLRLIASVKFKDKDNGIDLLSKSLSLLPERDADNWMKYLNGERNYFLIGSDYLEYIEDQRKYTIMYYQILRCFFKIIQKMI